MTRHGLDEPIAFAVKAALIDACTGLLNQVDGHGHEHGGMHGREMIRVYAAETAVPASTPKPGAANPSSTPGAETRFAGEGSLQSPDLRVQSRHRTGLRAGAAWVQVVLGDLDAYPHTPRICPVSRQGAPAPPVAAAISQSLPPLTCKDAGRNDH